MAHVETLDAIGRLLEMQGGAELLERARTYVMVGLAPQRVSRDDRLRVVHRQLNYPASPPPLCRDDLDGLLPNLA
jgi:hypothetical protein